MTTVVAVKAELGKTDTVDDDWLQNQIDAESLTICNYLGVEAAEDGTRNIGRETLVETIDRRAAWPYTSVLMPLPKVSTEGLLTLARRPVVSITSITEDGTAVASTDYQLAAMPGTLRRLTGSLPIAWPSTLIVVTYVAGWLLPGQTSRNLPADIEGAVIDLVKESWFSRKRDPDVKAEEIMGVRRVDYFFGAPGQGPLPPSVMARLDPYRNVNL